MTDSLNGPDRLMSPDASFFEGVNEPKPTLDQRLSPENPSLHALDNSSRAPTLTPSKRARFFRSPSPSKEEPSPSRPCRRSPSSSENKPDSAGFQTPTRTHNDPHRSSNKQATLSHLPASENHKGTQNELSDSVGTPIKKIVLPNSTGCPDSSDPSGESIQNPSHSGKNLCLQVPLFAPTSDDEAPAPSSSGTERKSRLDSKPNNNYNFIDLTSSPETSNVSLPSKKIRLTDQLKTSPLEAVRTPQAPAPSWEKKFLGGFMCEGYLIYSSARLREGESIWLSRSTANTVGKKSRKVVSAKKEDHVVRFESKSNGAFARLNEAFAKWIVHLIDLDLIYFEGKLMFPPPKTSIGDTVHCYLKAYLRRSAFVSPTNPIFNSMRNVQNPKLSNFYNNLDILEDKGRIDKQQSLNQLFDTIGLVPSTIDQSNTRPSVRFFAQKSKIECNIKVGSEEEGAIAQESIDLVYQKATAHDMSLDLQSPCDGFELPLRPYQQQGLSWLMKMEAKLEEAREEVSIHPLWEEYIFSHDEEQTDWSNAPNEKFYYNPHMGEFSYEFPRAARKCQGGILADEMGLGKTIQMAALICTARSPKHPLSKRPISHRRTILGQSDNGEYFSDENKNDDSGNQPKYVSRKSHATLVICPLTLIDQWKDELERCHKALQVFVYHSASKAQLADLAHQYDVVITTYGILAKEWSTIEPKSDSVVKLSGLFKFDWYRVILDEGHNIKNRNAQASRACYNLSGKRRWVLSGTPIVNRLEDLASLLHFIRLEPWGNFSFYRSFVTIPFARKDPKALVVVQTIIESVLLRREKSMKNFDGKPIITLPPKYISLVYLDLSPKERIVYDLVYQNAKSQFLKYLGQGTVMSNVTVILAILMRLRQAVLHPMLVLKKMKAMHSCTHDDNNIFAKMLKEYSDPAAAENSFAATQFSDLEKKLLGEGDEVEEQECVMCLDVMNSRVYLPCMHAFCKDCIMAYIEAKAGEETLCPSCQASFQETSIVEFVINRNKKPPFPDSEANTPPAQSSIMHQDEQLEMDTKPVVDSQLEIKSAYFTDVDCHTPTENIPKSLSGEDDGSMKGGYLKRNDFVSSTKLEALITHLKEARQTDPKFSAVVFSQFTRFLDLIEIVLNRDQFRFVRLDGTLSPSKRREALATFNDPKRPCILVCSLKVAGVGLNLIKANRIYMMDTWWNEAIENQAIDRIHRFGQDKPTFVVRFLVRDSIEDRMLAIQKKKRAVINDALGGADPKTPQDRTLEDLKSIFAA